MGEHLSNPDPNPLGDLARWRAALEGGTTEGPTIVGDNLWAALVVANPPWFDAARRDGRIVKYRTPDWVQEITDAANLEASGDE